MEKPFPTSLWYTKQICNATSILSAYTHFQCLIFSLNYANVCLVVCVTLYAYSSVQQRYIQKNIEEEKCHASLVAEEKGSVGVQFSVCFPPQIKHFSFFAFSSLFSVGRFIKRGFKLNYAIKSKSILKPKLSFCAVLYYTEINCTIFY